MYRPGDNNSFRVAFSQGFRYPSIFEAYSNINSGGVKRIGGLPVMSSGVYENAWLASSMTTFQSAVLKDINQSGLTKTQAIAKEKFLLVKNSYSYLKPEKINSFEFGFRSSQLQDQLMMDIDFYFNQYQHFIAQINVNVPKTNITDSIPYALNDKTQYNQFRIWTNSASIVYNYGMSAGVNYTIKKIGKLGINVTYSQLQKTTNDDALEDGFNTPNWIFNTSISNNKIFHNTGASISYKWQSAYATQTFLVNGTTPDYGSLDASIMQYIPHYKCTLKLGATNILNKYYYSYLGGPSIGGMYYLSITY